MNYNNGLRAIRHFFERLNQRSIEEKLYILSLIPLLLLLLLSYIADLADMDVSPWKWSLAIIFMVMVALGYVSAITSLILRHLKNAVFTAALGVLIFFYYQVIDSLSDHLIHLATGLNPDYFDNSHYFINLLVGITLSSLLIAFLLFPLTLIASVFQTLIKVKKKSAENLVAPRVIASFFIIIAGNGTAQFTRVFQSGLRSNSS